MCDRTEPADVRNTRGGAVLELPAGGSSVGLRTSLSTLPTTWPARLMPGHPGLNVSSRPDTTTLQGDLRQREI